ncbi:MULTISPECIES: TRAP transporter small permease [unclassified Avibacterium]|uniref:TRAP transporter small permease n=1 Tax=unclassified Avibacterium TaxID=2685287 RepID=UPI00202762DB|nr:MULTISPECIES: TRAP transporter small permease [unclassified Avibacterium]MCW9699047.1 TRAP transporter small permease [Avibacterium sp. 20-129]URL01919.1 TRAP transporter small permease [Avibacterium sp. 20-126]URL06757.1 TRAP transporter small permease [Avibacterium sp. 21-595]
MKSLVNFIQKTLSITVVSILATMSCLVFLNVVLRYGFNSSINITEEVSRYLFVWLTFLGAILAFNDDQHVHVTILTHKLSAYQRHLLSLLTDGLMLFCCYLIIRGGWTQFELNLTNYAPISGLPQGITYLASVVAGVFIGLLLSIRLVANLRLLLKGGIQ